MLRSSADDRSGLQSFLGFLVNHNTLLPPTFFVNVASKGLRVHVSGLESTLTSIPISVDSKGS